MPTTRNPKQANLPQECQREPKRTSNHQDMASSNGRIIPPSMRSDTFIVNQRLLQIRPRGVSPRSKNHLSMKGHVRLVPPIVKVKCQPGKDPATIFDRLRQVVRNLGYWRLTLGWMSEPTTTLVALSDLKLRTMGTSTATSGVWNTRFWLLGRRFHAYVELVECSLQHPSASIKLLALYRGRET